MSPPHKFMTELPSSSTPVTLRMGNRAAIRLYTSCLPNYLEVAPLHKGLVLMFDGAELIEEGMGFGVPVVKYKNKTFFSSSAKCYIQESKNRYTLIKSFALDAISRKRLGKAAYINDRFYSFFHRLFERAYLRHTKLEPVFNTIMELRRSLDIQTEFIKVKPRGKITFRYSCQANSIGIHVDLSELALIGCQEIIILNEQGSTFFRKYSDMSELVLFDGKIGAWERVTAQEASLSDAKEKLKFTLENKESGTLFRGWERTKGRFSWAGLGYSLKTRPSTFNYTIKLKVKE